MVVTLKVERNDGMIIECSVFPAPELSEDEILAHIQGMGLEISESELKSFAKALVGQCHKKITLYNGEEMEADPPTIISVPPMAILESVFNAIQV